MALGGIFDQVGGGFARYSTDVLWKVPHFEKMLYDNAQLVEPVQPSLIKPFRKPLYRTTVERTMAFIEREMTSRRRRSSTAHWMPIPKARKACTTYGPAMNCSSSWVRSMTWPLRITK